MSRFLFLFVAAVLCSPLGLAGQTVSPRHARPRPLVAQARYQPQAVPLVLQHKLDEAAGRTVYGCYRTGVILLKTEEHGGKSLFYYDADANPHHLTYMAPWKVMGIDRLNYVGGWSVFGLRLHVNGSIMVINGIAVSPAELQSSPDILQTLADKAGLFTSIEASGIHLSDLRAVQRAEIHRGMSEQEVACALGPPERSNLGSTGRREDFYRNGRLAVFIANGKVTDVRIDLAEPSQPDAGQ